MRKFPAAPQRVRMEMARCGYTLERLSAETQISRAVLRGILNGKTISTRCVCSLARAFDYDAASFMDVLSQESLYGNIEMGCKKVLLPE